MQVDAVVLDVDGVLVDVEDSYRRAIVESIERVHGETIERDQVQMFKNAGGFNNDWELTYAAALYLLAHERGLTVGLQSYTDEIALNDGGLDAAVTVVEEVLDEDAMAEVREEWNRDRLKDVFQQLYLGTELYREIEGDDPDIETTGFIYDEQPLITPQVLAELVDRFEIGILTGRPAAEAEIAIERVGLDELEDEVVYTRDDWEKSKPEPDALLELADVMESDSLVFVGDSLDDIKTAVNARGIDDDRDFYALGVLSGGLSGEEGRIEFELEGADEVLEDVNELPELLEDA